MMRIVILVGCLWLATSPLHAKIVFSSHRDDNAGNEIFTMDTDGGEPIQITHNRHDSFSPTWSPDGRQIAFNRNSHIYVMDADGENLRQLTKHNDKKDLHPDWSPNGKLIAFDRFAGNAPHRHANIYTVDPVTRFVRKVTDFDFNAQSPKWSPDGQWILFQGNGDLHAIRPNGLDKRIVSKHRHGEPKWLGGWAPDGKRIVYLQWGEGAAGDRIFVATLDMDLLREVAAAEVVIPPKVTINAVAFGKEAFIPPQMTINAVTFGADGQSILFVGASRGRATSFRRRLDTNELIQLTGAPFNDYSLQEWGRRLSVSPIRKTLPQTLGRVKAKALSK